MRAVEEEEEGRERKEGKEGKEELTPSHISSKELLLVKLKHSRNTLVCGYLEVIKHIWEGLYKKKRGGRGEEKRRKEIVWRRKDMKVVSVGYNPHHLYCSQTLCTWDEMRWDEMRWDEMRWDEMRWDEMRWDEMRCERIGWETLVYLLYPTQIT